MVDSLFVNGFEIVSVLNKPRIIERDENEEMYGSLACMLSSEMTVFGTWQMFVVVAVGSDLGWICQ